MIASKPTAATLALVLALVLLVGLFVPAAHAQTRQEDFDVMLAAVAENEGVFGKNNGEYLGTAGFPWDYETPTDPCNGRWQYLVCEGSNPNKTIVSIDLPDMDLEEPTRRGGLMPGAFGQLENLRTLAIRRGGLSSANVKNLFPEEWCALKALEDLELVRIGGGAYDPTNPNLFPQCIGEMTELLRISINGQIFTNTLTEAWQPLFNKPNPIQEISISNALMCGKLPNLANTSSTTFNLTGNCLDSSEAAYCAGGVCDNMGACDVPGSCFNYYTGVSEAGGQNTDCTCRQSTVACPGTKLARLTNAECTCQFTDCHAGYPSGDNCDCDCSTASCAAGATMGANCACDCSAVPACPDGGPMASDCSCENREFGTDRQVYRYPPDARSPYVFGRQEDPNTPGETLFLGPGYRMQLEMLEELDANGTVVASHMMDNFVFHRGVTNHTIDGVETMVVVHQARIFNNQSFVRTTDFLGTTGFSDASPPMLYDLPVTLGSTSKVLNTVVRIDQFPFQAIGNRLRLTFASSIVGVPDSEFATPSVTIEQDGAIENLTGSINLNMRIPQPEARNMTMQISTLTKVPDMDGEDTQVIQGYSGNGSTTTVDISWFSASASVYVRSKMAVPLKAAIVSDNNGSTTVVVTSTGDDEELTGIEKFLDDYFPFLAAALGLGVAALGGGSVLLVAALALCLVLLVICLCTVCCLYCAVMIGCQAVCIAKRQKKKKKLRKQQKRNNQKQSGYDDDYEEYSMSSEGYEDASSDL